MKNRADGRYQAQYSTNHFVHTYLPSLRLHFGAGLSLMLLLGSMLLGTAANSQAMAADDASATEPKVTFTSMVLPSARSQNASAVASRKILRAFLRKHPDYTVEPFMMPSIQGAGMDSAPLMGIASGQPPHAMYVNFRQSSSYINHGFLEPLEETLARVQSDNPRVREADEKGNWLEDPSEAEIAQALEDIKSRVPERVWPVIYREADVQKKGIPEGKHVWAMPMSVLVRALIYRRDLFQEAGLNPERSPKSWDELQEYARKISELPGKSGMMIMGGPTISWGAYSFMVSNNVRYMERSEDGKWRAAFATRDAAESIYFIIRMMKEQWEDEVGNTHSGAAVSSHNSTALKMRWGRGEIGMNFTYLDQDMMAQINPEVTGIAPIPFPEGGNPSGELNARMIGIFADSSPQQKIAVMQYIWFITGDEAKKIFVETMVDFGYGQFVNPNLLEQFGYTDILRQVPQSWRDTFETGMKHGVPEPYGKNTQFIYNKVSEPMNWAVTNAEYLLKQDREAAIDAIQEQLEDSADRVNEHMLGRLTPAQWRMRRIIGGTAMALIVLLFGGALYWVWRAFAEAERARGHQPPLRKFISAYLMVLPAIVIVLGWQYLPVILGAPLALFDYELVIESQWVGIDNFATVLFDERFWRSLFQTFYYALLVVGLGFWPPIMVAILLDEVPTTVAKYIFRTVFYLPAIVSGVIMVFLWLQFFQPNSDGYLNQIIMSVNHLGPVAGTLIKWILLGIWLAFIGVLVASAISLKQLGWAMRVVLGLFTLAMIGVTIWPLINAFLGPGEQEARALIAQGIDPAARSGISGVLHTLGGLVGRWNVQPLGWVADPGMAMICIVIPGIWASAGPGCLIYLAALKTVPDELIEAATIDGAGILQKIAYITLPRIKFLILIQLVGAIVGAFKGGTNIILAMTGGGPNGATRVLGLDVFERTFMELQYGIGAAMAWLLGGMVIVLTAYQLKRISRAEFKTADTTQDAKP